MDGDLSSQYRQPHCRTVDEQEKNESRATGSQCQQEERANDLGAGEPRVMILRPARLV